jgi:predicted NBD/HSP70 family sugar kinase
MDKSLGEIKRLNLQSQILNMLYREQQTTVSLLSNALNLSLPTIRTNLDLLISEGKVEIEGDNKNRGGRTPVVYRLNKDAFWTVAIEAGHFSSKIVIVNCHNQEVCQAVELETTIDDSDMVSKLYDAYVAMLGQIGSSGSQVVGVGVSLPGLVDSQQGINYTIKDQMLQNIGERFSRKFGMKAIIENDARMQALGELLFGEARDTQNALVVNWSWGIGLGIIHNGEIYSGSVGFSGEFSHIRMVDDGELCECGKKGCLQTIASLRYLLSIAREAVKSDVVSQLTTRFKNNPQDITAGHIIECAMKGDELSMLLLRKVSENLAWGLSILIQLYNPELILIKGPLASADKHVTIPLTLALNRFCLNEIVGCVDIRLGTNSDHLGLNGVAAQVFRNEFNL